MKTLWIKLLLLFVSIAYLSEVSNGLEPCGDWIGYNDEKCFKVLEKKSTELEALNECKHLDSSSSLITIHSQEEQEFISNLLVKYSKIAEKAWIGAKYNNQLYKWIDETEMNYANWAEDAVKDGTNPCVLMSLIQASLGKWSDELCTRSGLIVCQKKQELNAIVFKKELENLTKLLNEQQISLKQLNTTVNELNAKNTLQNETIVKQQTAVEVLTKLLNDKFNSEQKSIDDLVNRVNGQQTQLGQLTASIVPVGFIYTQYSNQQEPTAIWPSLKWAEVTQDYAGLFFRALGGGSGPFGQIQNADYSRITQVAAEALDITGSHPKHPRKTTPLAEGAWSDNVIDWDSANFMSFYTSKTENRPVNVAIRIWKRIA